MGGDLFVRTGLLTFFLVTPPVQPPASVRTQAQRIRLFVKYMVSAISQPVSSLAFLTDRVLWGTGDFRFLRNAMIVAAVVGFGDIWLLDLSGASALYWAWAFVGIWVTERTAFGVLRIWLGIGKSVFQG